MIERDSRRPAGIWTGLRHRAALWRRVGLRDSTAALWHRAALRHPAVTARWRPAAAVVAALALWLACGAGVGRADIVTQTVEYEDEGTPLEGFLAYDDAVEGARPGILIVHQWMGLSENEKMRARMLAGLGYVAFAADVYGKGVRPATAEEAAAESGKYLADRALLRRRVAAGLKRLKEESRVNPQKTAAIGYCFGGCAVLELARSGADVQGVVSFHGLLNTPNPKDAENIRCPLLVMQGAEDPYANDESIQKFLDEMRAANVDFQFIDYGGAVHGFTQKSAGDDKSKGVAYNAKADARSWVAMRGFFQEIFQ